MKLRLEAFVYLLLICWATTPLQAGSIYDTRRSATEEALPWWIEAGIAGGVEVAEANQSALNAAASSELRQAASELVSGHFEVQKRVKNPGGVPGFVMIFDLLVPLTANNLMGDAFYTLIGVDEMGQAIQIDFWNGQIWARNGNFTRSTTEGAMFDTSTLRRYQLAVFGGTYTLSADGVDLFSGVLRSYPEPLRSTPGFYYGGVPAAAPPMLAVQPGGPGAGGTGAGGSGAGGTGSGGSGTGGTGTGGTGTGGTGTGSGTGSGSSGSGSTGGSTGGDTGVGTVPAAIDSIPEPSTWALMVAAGLVALGLKRKR